ncbi:MAG: hypothetical protein HW389_3222, partial [Bacteroidetes bacterium]|nr:hypothetical protein [Bacteroidota bacterium]
MVREREPNVENPMNKRKEESQIL